MTSSNTRLSNPEPVDHSHDISVLCTLASSIEDPLDKDRNTGRFMDETLRRQVTILDSLASLAAVRKKS